MVKQVIMSWGDKLRISYSFRIKLLILKKFIINLNDWFNRKFAFFLTNGNKVQSLKKYHKEFHGY